MRLRCCPASAPMWRPTAVDPVNEMTRTRGWVISASPVPGPPGSTCSSPSGRPASSKTRARTTPPQTAVRGSGLSTTASPRASAGATERIARICGKLNGEITPTTPTGTRSAQLSRGDSLGSTSPSGREGSVAASGTCPATRGASRPPLGPAEVGGLARQQLPVGPRGQRGGLVDLLDRHVRLELGRGDDLAAFPDAPALDLLRVD